jgi:hypothetical protein
MTGRHGEAADRFAEAAALTRNETERALFEERAEQCRDLAGHPNSPDR